jgi:hypothetical protein
MTDLERALLELEVEWPATPDLAAAVTARIGAAPVAGRERAGVGRVGARRGIARPAWWHARGWRRRAAIALASLLVLGGGTLAASPSARSTVFRWLGLQGVEIRRERPSATPGPLSRLGESLDLGIPITPARARREGALFPRSLPAPDAAYLGPLVGGQRGVALVYAPRDGLPPSKVTGVALIVQTFRATLDTLILKKLVAGGGDLQSLTVAGSPAYWISGEPHGFQYATPSGGAFGPQRLADHTLLVERDGRLLRVEGPLTRAAAVRIAEDAR